MIQPFLGASLSPVPGNLLTNGVAVALIATLHVQIATFITGSSTLAVVSESISMARNDPRHERLAHGLVKAMAYLFTFGSAVAIFFVLWILTGLWSFFWISLQKITFWILIWEAATFLCEIVVLYTLYANWDRLRRWRRARLGLLILLTIVDWWQMFFINVVASYMLVPNGGDKDQVAQVLNPEFLPLQLHRTVGNLAWAGALIAFSAGARYLWETRRKRREAAAMVPARSVGALAAAETVPGPETREREERLHYLDWLGQWGMLWAVGLSLFQIWIGYTLAKEIQLHSYPAWYRMMFGALSNVFLTQIFLLGMIFILGNLYFIRRMRASGVTKLGVQRFCLLILVLSTLLAIQPAFFALDYSSVAAAHLDRAWWNGGLLNPIGNFIPNKVLALTMIMVFGLVSLTSYLRAYSEGRIRHGDTTRRIQGFLLAMGVTVSLMMGIMGVIRENSRQPYLIYGELRISHQQLTGTPGSPGATPGP
jgi:cytochrome bd ubiquinol oxidase subunit I